MVDSPATRPSLLVRLRDPRDRDAWQEFFQVYSSVIYGYARRQGMQDADAADLMQDVLRRVASSADKLDYDPQRGTFRGWLFTVTRNRFYDLTDRKRKQVQATGGSDMVEQLNRQPAASDGAEAAWEQEYQQGILRWAMDRVRGEFQETTWQAFLLTAMEGKSPQAVAEQLHTSPGSVYVAKSRVLARLRAEVQQWKDD
jgi:RNA polymerase sigma-70 factor (ECF subfamily)